MVTVCTGLRQVEHQFHELSSFEPIWNEPGATGTMSNCLAPGARFGRSITICPGASVGVGVGVQLVHGVLVADGDGVGVLVLVAVRVGVLVARQSRG
jgi:hypothetical protein